MKLSLPSLSFLILLASSGVAPSPLETASLARSNLERRQNGCAGPIAVPNVQVYRLDNVMVDTGAKKFQFELATTAEGAASLTCTPDLTIRSWRAGKRYECNGLGNGVYEFLYQGSGEMGAIWLQYNNHIRSTLAGTAAMSLTCAGTACTADCPVYVYMLKEDP